MSRSPVVAYRSSFSSLALFALAAACSGEESDGAGKVPCEGERPVGGTCLQAVEGRVLGPDALPAADLPVTVCGPVCYRGTTDKEGSFLIPVEAYVLSDQYSVQPHGSPDHSTFYYPLPQGLEDGVFDAGDLRVVELPESGPGLVTKTELADDIPPAQSVQSGPVTLNIAAGTLVRLAIADALLGAEGREFRAVLLEQEEQQHFAPHLNGALVYALGPFEADFLDGQNDVPQVAVDIEVGDALAEGSQVEILALGSYLDPDWLTPSTFERIGTAQVTAGVVHLAEDAEGPGLRHITWMAVRPLP